MHNKIPKPAPVLQLMLSLALLSGSITGYFDALHQTEPAWSEISSTIALLILMLIWYHTDSTQHEFKRPAWLTVLIAGFALIGIPCYLIKSRAPEERLPALGWLTVYTLSLMAASLVGETMMGWVMQ